MRFWLELLAIWFAGSLPLGVIVGKILKRCGEV
jgi:glycerol-3-phosphate acyltransferase PlsY